MRVRACSWGVRGVGQVQLAFRILSRSRRCAIIGIGYRVEVAYRQG